MDKAGHVRKISPLGANDVHRSLPASLTPPPYAPLTYTPHTTKHTDGTMNDPLARRWRPEELGEWEADGEEEALDFEDEEEETTPPPRHHHHASSVFGEPGHYGPAAPQPPHPPAPPPPPRPPTVMTGFVRGKARYADEQEHDHQPTRSTSTTAAAAPNDDECPSALYAALTARPAEEPEVTIVENDEVEILPTRKRQRRQRRAQGAPLPNGAADGIILLDSDNDDDAGAQPAPTNAASANVDVILLFDDDEASLPLPTFDCVICQERITSTDQATHERSTLHTFNAQKAVSTRRIMLPESNRGVQLLARLGWKEDKGLGKDGQGQIQPAKSTLKLDRTGLGHTQQLPARVTHFPSHNAEQAARAVDGKSEAQRKVEEMELRAREGRAAARGGGGKEGGGWEGSVTLGEVGRCETARERERRSRKEKETRARITAELNWEEG